MMSGDVVLAWAALVSSSAALIIGAGALARRRHRAAGHVAPSTSGIRRSVAAARPASELPPFPPWHPRIATPPPARAPDHDRRLRWTSLDADGLLSGDDDDVVTVRFGGLDGGVHVSRHSAPGARGPVAPAASQLDENQSPPSGPPKLRSIGPPPPLVAELLPVDEPLHRPWIIPDVGAAAGAPAGGEVDADAPDEDDDDAVGIRV